LDGEFLDWHGCAAQLWREFLAALADIRHLRLTHHFHRSSRREPKGASQGFGQNDLPEV
jgi:hypothetical protein